MNRELSLEGYYIVFPLVMTKGRGSRYSQEMHQPVERTEKEVVV